MFEREKSWNTSYELKTLRFVAVTIAVDNALLTGSS
jgi:hypothetical protein